MPDGLESSPPRSVLPTPGRRSGFVFRPIEWLAAITGIAVVVALIWPAPTSGRGEGLRIGCKDNLKYIGLALHNYREEYGTFPPAYIANENGRPMHSWRVLILPFLEKQDLYDQYRFDEPWDGPNNSKLAFQVVDRFNCPAEKKKNGGVVTPLTSYVAIIGPGTAWPGETPTRLDDVTDGTDKTLFVVEVANSGIHWMEPRDLHVLQMAPTINGSSGQGISSGHLGGAHVVKVDGAVRFLSEKLPRETLKAILTRAAGEAVGEF